MVLLKKNYDPKIVYQMMLRRNQHQHPLIYMRGMKSSDLASILDFMYFGEIEMSQVFMS